MLSQFRSSIPLWYWKDLQGHISSSLLRLTWKAYLAAIHNNTGLSFHDQTLPHTVSPTLTGVRHTNDSQPIQTLNGADMGTDQFPECMNTCTMLPHQNQNLQKMEAEAKHKPLYMFGAALNSQCKPENRNPSQLISTNNSYVELRMTCARYRRQNTPTVRLAAR